MTTYRKIEVNPIAGALGAEIGGVDLAAIPDEDTFDEIRQAFHENLVIFFRDQSLTPEQHRSFARRFGELDIHPYAAGLEAYPEVMPVIKEASDTASNFGGTWHTDVTFYEKPALGSILYALDVPESGGDTMFANMYMAYDALSDGMKLMLDGMTAMHDASRSYGDTNSRASERMKKNSGSMKIRTGIDATKQVEHPVIRTHPATGTPTSPITSRAGPWRKANPCCNTCMTTRCDRNSPAGSAGSRVPSPSGTTVAPSISP